MTLRSLIADLVRIETENPPGNEAPCAEYVAGWFEERDIDATLVDEPDPDRPQVAAEVGEGSPAMVLNGHLDVVPAGDRGEWGHDPYAAEVEGGRLYGRGAADMKAGVAIAMLTLDRLADDFDSGDLDGRLVFHGAMGEETADPGTRTLLSLGYDGDYGVCLEPTGMRTATSQKGLAWYEITVPGDPGHASRPDAGTNAIEGARPLLDALKDYDDRVREREHSLLGPAYATVTRFRAGTKENVIPESARITVDRRFLPDESPEDIDEEIESVLADVAGVEAAWERTRTYESAEVNADSPLAEVFRDHSARVAGAPREPWGIQASTDGRNLINDAGMEAVIWGPGDLAQAHSFDEYVDLDAAADGLDALEGAVRETLDTR